MLDTILRDNLGTGILMVVANGTALMDHVRSAHNAGDGFYIAPTPGSSRAAATISDSVFAHNGLSGIRAETVGNATASVQVERSILSNNASRGFRTFVGAAPDAAVRFTLTRNAISANGGDGVLAQATAPGSATGSLLQNSVHSSGVYGIRAFGSGAELRVGGNVVLDSGLEDFGCTSGSVLQSDGNNNLFSIDSAAGCYVTVGGL